MDKPKPTVDELVTRVGALTDAVDQMLGALRADLVSLREELQRLRDANPTIPAPASNEQVPRVSGAVPKGMIAEERVAPKAKRDPRMDD